MKKLVETYLTISLVLLISVSMGSNCHNNDLTESPDPQTEKDYTQITLPTKSTIDSCACDSIIRNSTKNRVDSLIFNSYLGVVIYEAQGSISSISFVCNVPPILLQLKKDIKYPIIWSGEVHRRCKPYWAPANTLVSNVYLTNLSIKL